MHPPYRFLTIPFLAFIASTSIFIQSARAEKGEWAVVSDGVVAQLQQEGKKIGYPGLTAGIGADPASGDAYMVVCDQGLWKTADRGKTFHRVDGGAIGGRCETGFALDFDPAGKRLACFMIYGACASTNDGGKTWNPWKTNHLDFGVTDWEATGKVHMAIRHESGGILCVSGDDGQTWKNLGKEDSKQKIAKEDREFTGVGIFDAKSLLASRGDEILRSTDGGAHWKKVADAKVAAPVMRVRKGIGYWMTDDGLMTSKDKGATWTLASPVKAVFGPYFGKTEKQMVVVGDEGFSESTDGGTTWKVVAPLPEGFSVKRVGPNYAWDAVHDVFYASSMGKPAYAFQR